MPETLPQRIQAELTRHPSLARWASQALDARLSASAWLHSAARHAATERAFSLSGPLRGRAPLTALYVGDPVFVRDLDQLLFSSRAAVTDLGRASPDRLGRSGTDVVITESWPWETSDDPRRLVVQPWLEARCEPRTTYSTYLRDRVSENVRRSLKKAQEKGLATRIDGSEAEAVRFLREVAAPMARKLYGDETVLGAPEKVLAWRGRSNRIETLLVERDGELLGGAVLVHFELRREVMIHSYGLLGPALDDRKLRSEVTATVNAEVFETACEKGFAVNLGQTRPFLDDGVFNHKRQWGAHLAPVVCQPRFRFDLVTARWRILAAAPLFVLKSDGVHGVASFDPDEEMTPKLLTDRLSGWVFEGLKGIEVVMPVRQPVGSLSAVTQIKGCPVTFAHE
ncbi:MAG TPA: GNAT family N-acetyltransferase [Myxococcales bacterium]|jgi:hypothetical protein